LKCSDLPVDTFRRQLGAQGIWLPVSSWVFHLRSDDARVAHGLQLLYGDYAVALDDPGFADFHVQVRRARGLRRWMTAQVVFEVDGDQPFHPFPASQAMPMLEWGMNWCVSNFTNHLLVLHSAVLEREGRAVLLPAPPGHGKSTLCAALAARGWRLLSDELALVDLHTGLLHPFPRPISLKNRSIDVISAFAPGAVLSAPVRDTVKGDIAYVRPPPESVRRSEEPATPGWLVFPRYRPGSTARFLPLHKADAFKQLAEQAFNYYVLGRLAFETVAGLIDRCDCFSFEYETLESGVAAFEALSTQAPGLAWTAPS
jgi:HprK-related kinase A